MGVWIDGWKGEWINKGMNERVDGWKLKSRIRVTRWQEAQLNLNSNKQ